MYYVYILESEKSGRHYVGSTSNLERRLTEHNEGKVKSTKRYCPWKIIFTEEFSAKQKSRDKDEKQKVTKLKQFKNCTNILIIQNLN